MKWQYIDFLFIALFGCYLLASDQSLGQNISAYSGCVTDGHNAYGMHGLYRQTIDFSSDGNIVAYLWATSTYMSDKNREFRPVTLTDKLEVRVRTIPSAAEWKETLDSVDFRPGGELYYQLDGRVIVAPDSRNVAAMSSRQLLLFDVGKVRWREITNSDGFYGSFSWRGSNTLVFSTCAGKVVKFWRWQIDKPWNTKAAIYYTDRYVVTSDDTSCPPHLYNDHWSPDGRFVCFRKMIDTQNWTDVILDLDTGTIRSYPFSLGEQSWRPDGRLLLVCSQERSGDTLLLVNPISGDVTNLTGKSQSSGERGITEFLSGNAWTADGKYIIAGNKLVQPNPFEIILSTKNLLRWAPIPGWVLLQGQTKFKWINYAGSMTFPISGWPNDWVWSPAGSYAARCENNTLLVFRPQLPVDTSEHPKGDSVPK